MTAAGGSSTSPICYIGIEVRNGVRQIVFVAQNSMNGGTAPRPLIPNYSMDSGWYFQTASSPNGITEFPKQQWVHIAVYYKMADATGHNGQVQVWQDGVRIMDLADANLDTFGGYDGTNSAGDLLLQFGIYGGPQSTTQRLYVDDFKVTNYRPLP
jgi:hypothetical protein